MHKLIGIAIKADKSEDDASKISRVEQILEEWLVGENLYYDWYNLSSDRWEEAGKVFSLKSEEGKDMVDQLIEEDKKILAQNFERVRQVMETARSYEDVINDLFAFRMLGAEGEAFIFTEDYETVRPQQLHYLYNKFTDMILVDVHY